MNSKYNFAVMPKIEVQNRLRMAQIELTDAVGVKKLLLEAVIRATAAELKFRWKYRTIP